MSSPVLILSNTIQLIVAPVKVPGQAMAAWHDGLWDAYQRFRKIHPVWGIFTECLLFPLIALCFLAGVIWGALGAVLSFCGEMIKLFWWLPIAMLGYLFILAYFRCALVVTAMEFLKKALF